MAAPLRRGMRGALLLTALAVCLRERHAPRAFAEPRSGWRQPRATPRSCRGRPAPSALAAFGADDGVAETGKYWAVEPLRSLERRERAVSRAEL